MLTGGKVMKAISFPNHPCPVPGGLQEKQGAALPSGPCTTEFSSGIQAGQTIRGKSIFLNFISMPLGKKKLGLETLVVSPHHSWDAWPG